MPPAVTPNGALYPCTSDHVVPSIWSRPDLSSSWHASRVRCLGRAKIPHVEPRRGRPGGRALPKQCSLKGEAPREGSARRRYDCAGPGGSHKRREARQSQRKSPEVRSVWPIQDTAKVYTHVSIHSAFAGNRIDIAKNCYRRPTRGCQRARLSAAL